MKIGIISDTHIPKAAGEIPQKVYDEFKNCGLILHAGDHVSPAVMEDLRKLAPVKAVHGNMDPQSIQQSLPDKEIVKVNGKKIGLTHGYGPPTNIINTVKGIFSDADVDAIVFGHSHSPINEVHDGILFFNPGTPTDKVFATFNSFGILEVNDKIKGRIIRL